ncbi:Response regulator protein PilR [Gammaproteobacteria bacterium]
MENPLALIVDDEPDILELLEITLRRMNVGTCTATNLEAARAILTRRSVNLCITDLRLPDGDGTELVEHIQRHYQTIPVAIITAHGNMETAIRALKGGAFDFVSKPVDLQVLRNLVSTALKLSRRPSVEQSTRCLLLGDSAGMRTVRATITKVARSQAPVHICGESGTGKELVARMIHEQGPRAERPFIPVNCGAIPSELMESELFGHRKGAFSGAVTEHEGLFQAAAGGTLFLDEVADLPLPMQVKLLRVIQEKAMRPVGASREIPMDVRILSATHKDLATLVQEGNFRQDLYYRVNVIELHVPPLRERCGDIPMLIEHFLERCAESSGLTVPRLSNAAQKALLGYNFPGNVRELENILERAITLCDAGVIEECDLLLPEDITNTPPPIIPVETVIPNTAMTQQTTGGTVTEGPLDPFLNSVEKETILKALEQTRWNRTAAARILGISFRALRYRLKKLGLD